MYIQSVIIESLCAWEHDMQAGKKFVVKVKWLYSKIKLHFIYLFIYFILFFYFL